MDQDCIVSVSLLTQREFTVLGSAFDRAWPIEQTPGFAELLRAIDEADLKLKQGCTDNSEATH